MTINKERKLIHDLGYMFETIGGYFDMGNTEEARKHFEVAYKMLGDYTKDEVNKLIKEQNDRRNNKKAHK